MADLFVVVEPFAGAGHPPLWFAKVKEGGWPHRRTVGGCEGHSHYSETAAEKCGARQLKAIERSSVEHRAAP